MLKKLLEKIVSSTILCITVIMSFHLDDLSAIPHLPWVYLFYGKKDELLYIWKAKDLKKRVAQYFSAWSVWKQDMLAKATKVDFMTVMTESEALYLEDNLIKKHKPPYNALLKGDNSYVYIKITKDDYPVIYTTRYRVADWSLYLWPKHFTRDLYTLLQYLRKLLRYRWCTQSVFRQWKLCSDYHFGTCLGWCVYNKMNSLGEQEKKQENLQQVADVAGRGLPVNAAFKPIFTHEESIAENKQIVRLLVDFFGWKTKPIEEKLMAQMKNAVEKEHFEYAAQLRDIYTGLSHITEKQHVVISEIVTGKIMKVREIAGWYVLAIVNMYEGKMIDVIRLKYRTTDTEIDDIVSDFRTEYGDCKVEISEQQARCFTDGLKKIPKNIRAEIEAVLDRFIDAMVASSTFEKENIMNDVLQSLQARYEFPQFPYSIECIDISHLSGWWTSGALVCMREGLLFKKWYRKYKIGKVAPEAKKKKADDEMYGKNIHAKNAMIVNKDIKKPTARDSDDYASLREVLMRRFYWVDLDKDDIPAVFILDGWKGQLGVVQKLYEESIKFQKVFERVHFCSLGKWEARARSSKTKWATEYLYRYEITSEGVRKIREKALEYDDVDRTITGLRDEAHRFANKYRTKQMSMEWAVGKGK